MRSRLPGPAGLLWVTAAVLLGAIVLEPLWDPDLWWHLAVGQWIHVHAQVPHADPFAVAGVAKPWLAHEWLFEWILYGVYRIGAERALVLLPALAAVGTAAFALGRAGSRKVPAVLGAPVVLLALMPTQDFWTQRPQLITFLLLSWLLFDLQRHAEGQRVVLWKWLPLVAFWANVHGAFVIAPLAVGAQLAGAWVERLRPPSDTSTERGSPARRPRDLALLFLGTLLAGLCNPRGIHLYGHAFMYASSDWHGVAIVDWQSPNFADPRRLAFAIVILAAFVLAALSRAARAGDLFLIAGFTLMALRWQRNIPLALIAAAPLAAIWLHRGWQSRSAAATPEPEHEPTQVSWPKGLAHLAGIVVLAILATAARWPCHGGSCERPGAFPEHALAALDHFPREPSGRLLNYFDWGGYLLWHRPGSDVYIDGRAPELDLERLHRYGRIHRVEADWRMLLDEERIARVLYPAHSALARTLEANGWNALFEDDTAVLLERPSP